jgi:hypothetical protein
LRLVSALAGSLGSITEPVEDVPEPEEPVEWEILFVQE